MVVHHGAWHRPIASWWFCLRPIESRRLYLGLVCEGILTECIKAFVLKEHTLGGDMLTHQKVRTAASL